jgi:hypothetical protein
VAKSDPKVPLDSALQAGRPDGKTFSLQLHPIKITNDSKDLKELVKEGVSWPSLNVLIGSGSQENSN